VEDLARDELYCEHHNRLYECPDPEHDTPVTEVGRVDASVEVVAYYHGSAMLYTRITDRQSSMFGGSICTPVTCTHMHTTREAAEKCGEQLATRTAREMNKANGVTR
jgi:hypothetical protein